MNQKSQGQCVISGKSIFFFRIFEEFEIVDRFRLTPKFIWGAEMAGFKVVQKLKKKYWTQVKQRHGDHNETGHTATHLAIGNFCSSGTFISDAV